MSSIAIAMNRDDELRDEIKSLKAENAALKKELEEALPWLLFYRDGLNLGQMAERLNTNIYAFHSVVAKSTRRIVQGNDETLLEASLKARIEELQPVVDAAVAEETAWDKAEKEDIGFFDAHKATDKRRAAVKAYLKKREGV